MTDPSLHDVGRDEGSAILQQLTEDVSRIAAVRASLSDEEAAAIATIMPSEASGRDEPRIEAAFVRSIIRAGGCATSSSAAACSPTPPGTCCST